jgi:hypothetical protein
MFLGEFKRRADAVSDIYIYIIELQNCPDA